MKKSVVLLGLVTLLVASPAMAQQPSQGQSQAAVPTGAGCVSQYVEVPGRTPAGLLATGFDIKGAVTGGLWMQKDREVFYCNASGRLQDRQAICWQLREPGPGGLC